MVSGSMEDDFLVLEGWYVGFFSHRYASPRTRSAVRANFCGVGARGKDELAKPRMILIIL